ncbi:MAG: DUF1538 domain-containing protein [Kiritimatiellaeota bacterium]|nr:DUF1538 domain-containing protein [Kiritimatiellota bacterium]
MSRFLRNSQLSTLNFQLLPMQIYDIQDYGSARRFPWLPLLALIIVLAHFAGPVFPGLAFDCASATTGPVNIPVNLAIAIGLATAVGVDPIKAGFGIVGLCCLGTAISVLTYGVLFGGSLGVSGS